MCGIIAYFSDKRPIDRVNINRALESLHHRGPDDRQFWTNDADTIALGHTRLSIIGLETGTQPLHSENGGIHAVVNGEFYDFERIREELIAKGHHFKTQSDSEILINLYAEYGEACLEHLRGEFAFVLYDQNADKIFAARDRFGIKPLYTYQDESGIYFASEVKALFELGVPRKWNPEGVNDLEYGLYSQEKTIFKGVKAVRPAHSLSGKLQALESRAYWDFNYPTKDAIDLSIDEQTAIEMFSTHFEEAVKLRLRADVGVANYLSGGLDSCSVLAMMAKFRSDPIDAFTLSFKDNDQYDEESIAKEMAAKVGANHHVIDVTNNELRDNFADCVYNNETLLLNNNTVAKFMLSRYVRDHGYKVVLTGEGADEVFGGYVPFRQDVILYNNEGQDKATIDKLFQELLASNQTAAGLLITDNDTLPLEQVEKALGFVPTAVKNLTARGMAFQQFLPSEISAQREKYDPFAYMLGNLDLTQMKGREPVTQSMYLWSKMILPAFILTTLGDRVEMAHSIEGRVPFLDHKLVEAMAKVPVCYKIKGLTEKYIVKEGMKDYITKSVYERQKHPFVAPPATDHKKAAMLELMQDVFYSDALKNLPFYDTQKVLSLFDKLPSMTEKQQKDLDTIFLHILSACIMQERFNLTV